MVLCFFPIFLFAQILNILYSYLNLFFHVNSYKSSLVGLTDLILGVDGSSGEIVHTALLPGSHRFWLPTITLSLVWRLFHGNKVPTVPPNSPMRSLYETLSGCCVAANNGATGSVIHTSCPGLSPSWLCAR